MTAGYSAIPSETFLHELGDDEFRNGFVADHVRTRLALLVRSLREQRGWSQAELGRRMGKPQSVVSRIEDPDYGRLSTQTVFEIASAFGLPVYIDLPEWDEWFRLMEDMSIRNLRRRSFDADYLISIVDAPMPNGAMVAAFPASAVVWAAGFNAFDATLTYGHVLELTQKSDVVAKSAIQNRLFGLSGTLDAVSAINNVSTAPGMSMGLTRLIVAETSRAMAEVSHA